LQGVRKAEQPSATQHGDPILAMRVEAVSPVQNVPEPSTEVLDLQRQLREQAIETEDAAARLQAATSKWKQERSALEHRIAQQRQEAEEAAILELSAQAAQIANSEQQRASKKDAAANEWSRERERLMARATEHAQALAEAENRWEAEHAALQLRWDGDRKAMEAALEVERIAQMQLRGQLESTRLELLEARARTTVLNELLARQGAPTLGTSVLDQTPPPAQPLVAQFSSAREPMRTVERRIPMEVPKIPERVDGSEGMPGDNGRVSADVPQMSFEKRRNARGKYRQAAEQLKRASRKLP